MFERWRWGASGLVIAAAAGLVALDVAWLPAPTADLRAVAQVRSSPPATSGPTGQPAVRSAATVPVPPVLIVPFGAPGDLPVVGRWTESRTTYIGLYRPSISTFYLRTRNSTGAPDRVVTFGESADIPLAGRWCRGARSDAPAVYRPRVHSLIFRCGNDVSTIPFGAAGDVPVAGDWWGSGHSSIGVYRPSQNTFFLSRGPSVGATIALGAPGDVPVIRHLPAHSLVGVYRPSVSTFFLANRQASSAPLITIAFGTTKDIPLVGDWTGDGVAKVGVYRPSESTFYLKTTFP